MDRYTYEDNRLRMAHKAHSFGIAALASSILLFSFPYFAIGFGFLSILFAILSKGYKPKIDRDAKHGMVFGIIAVCIGVTVLGSTTYKLYSDKEYRNTITTVIDEMYGDMYEEEFGENFSDIINDFFEGGDGIVNL